jgi:hypothetical protein
MNTYAVRSRLCSSGTTYRLGVPRDGARRKASDHEPVSIFLIEIHMANAGALELERAMRMLAAAQARMLGSATVTHTLMAGLSPADARLICLVEAASLEAARRLLSLALLPPGRIREISHPAGTLLVRGHPGGDADPGVEPELVEDVVDVRLDGPLGEE